MQKSAYSIIYWSCLALLKSVGLAVGTYLFIYMRPPIYRDKTMDINEELQRQTAKITQHINLTCFLTH